MEKKGTKIYIVTVKDWQNHVTLHGCYTTKEEAEKKRKIIADSLDGSILNQFRFRYINGKWMGPNVEYHEVLLEEKVDPTERDDFFDLDIGRGIKKGIYMTELIDKEETERIADSYINAYIRHLRFNGYKVEKIK